MSELNLVGKDIKRLSTDEQKRLDYEAAKNGLSPIRVTDYETHVKAVVNGLSDSALSVLSVVLRDEK